MNIKKFLKSRNIFRKILNLKNGFWKKKLHVKMEGQNIIINGIRIKQKGSDNYLYLGEGVHICNCTINIYGNNNRIVIGGRCSLRETNFYIEDNNNEIRIGSGTTTTGEVDMAVIEGTNLYIGQDCMISSNIYISTGDGHSVCDRNGKRLNDSEDIVIGNHVWIGTRVIIGKGFRIGNNSIIAAGGVCIRSGVKDGNVIMGGNPARIVKCGVDWKRERV